MEIVSKLINLLDKLLPTIIGWFLAKQDSKVDNLSSEVENLKNDTRIDSIDVSEESNNAENWN